MAAFSKCHRMGVQDHDRAAIFVSTGGSFSQCDHS